MGRSLISSRIFSFKSSSSWRSSSMFKSVLVAPPLAGEAADRRPVYSPHLLDGLLDGTSASSIVGWLVGESVSDDK